jgi:hypothetical protein
MQSRGLRAGSPSGGSGCLSKSLALSSPACTQTSSFPPGDPEMAAPPGLVSGVDRQSSATCKYARQRHLLAHNGITIVEALGVDGSIAAERVCRVRRAPAVFDRVRGRAIPAHLYHGVAVAIHHRRRNTEPVRLARLDGGCRDDLRGPRMTATFRSSTGRLPRT